jgi:hypothetical protein
MSAFPGRAERETRIRDGGKKGCERQGSLGILPAHTLHLTTLVRAEPPEDPPRLLQVVGERFPFA